MRLTVVLSHEQQLTTAGVRIRYLRLAEALRDQGHEIVTQMIDDIRALHDIAPGPHVLTKCHDARSLILAEAIRARGQPVGVDIFDDYFTQTGDTRLVHLRRWWDEIVPRIDFVLCATPMMADRLGGLAPGKPVHVLHDPFDTLDPDAIGAAVERKVGRALRGGTIDVGWFGMGDNPYFPVGLDDLAAFGEVLSDLGTSGLAPRLTVLTNLRAMTTLRLEALSALPVPVRLGEWTVEREAELLEASLLCFLPVNGQAFSTVKSLNRAVTALTAGVQVLSAGFPLYRELSAWIYDRPRDLLDDLRWDRLRLRRDTVVDFAAALSRTGDPRIEAERLGAFLSAISARRPLAAATAEPAPPPPTRGAVLHGVATQSVVHKFAQRHGWLSIGGPLNRDKHHFDLHFETDADGELWLLLSKRAVDRLRPEDAAFVETMPDRAGKPFFRLRLGDAAALPGLAARTTIERMVFYPSTTAAARAILNRLFPGLTVTLSEGASPFAEAALASAGSRAA